jgi:hypothetical protein
MRTHERLSMRKHRWTTIKKILCVIDLTKAVRNAFDGTQRCGGLVIARASYFAGHEDEPVDSSTRDR